MINTKAIRPIVIPPGLEDVWEAKMIPLREAAWLQVEEQGGLDIVEYFKENKNSVHEDILTNILDVHIGHGTVPDAVDEMREYISEFSHQLRYDTPESAS